MNKIFTQILALAAILLTVGCNTPLIKTRAAGAPPVMPESETYGPTAAALEELLKGAHVVAGGLMIEWVAPENGKAILVEELTKRMVVTRSLGQHQAFSFKPVETIKEIEELLGVPIKDARLVLYFLPDAANSQSGHNPSDNTSSSQ